MATTITNLVLNPRLANGTGQITSGQASRIVDPRGTGMALQVTDATGGGYVVWHAAMPSAAGVQSASFDLYWPESMVGRTLLARLRRGASTFATSSNMAVQPVEGWQRIRVNGTYASLGTDTTQFIVIEATSRVTGDTYIVTKALLHEGDGATDYFDGDSPNAVWTGTPHTSTSVLTIPDSITAPLMKIGSPHIGPLRVGKD